MSNKNSIMGLSKINADLHWRLTAQFQVCYSQYGLLQTYRHLWSHFRDGLVSWCHLLFCSSAFQRLLLLRNCMKRPQVQQGNPWDQLNEKTLLMDEKGGGFTFFPNGFFVQVLTKPASKNRYSPPGHERRWNATSSEKVLPPLMVTDKDTNTTGVLLMRQGGNAPSTMLPTATHKWAPSKDQFSQPFASELAAKFNISCSTLRISFCPPVHEEGKSPDCLKTQRLQLESFTVKRGIPLPSSSLS